MNVFFWIYMVFCIFLIIFYHFSSFPNFSNFVNFSSVFFFQISSYFIRFLRYFFQFPIFPSFLFTNRKWSWVDIIENHNCPQCPLNSWSSWIHLDWCYLKYSIKEAQTQFFENFKFFIHLLFSLQFLQCKMGFKQNEQSLYAYHGIAQLIYYFTLFFFKFVSISIIIFTI